MNKTVRLGIVGAGTAGVYHATYLKKGEVARCELVAICDSDESRLEHFSELETFTDSLDLFRSGTIDAVLITTPHYFHTTVGIQALEHGLHVLVEKPLSVHKADCERLLEAHRDKSRVFGIMLNYRALPRFRLIKQMIDEGDLGEIVRVNWIATDWFRSEAYYSSAAWRGTWKGEGGGVLVNQCPHQLDLITWWFGMPSSVRAFCKFGSRHDIEVEDQVSAYLEFPSGATGVFIASTGEAPGTNRLEICGERARLVLEDSRLKISRNEMPAREFIRNDTEGFSRLAAEHSEIPVESDAGSHPVITQNFIDAILDGVPLIAPAEDGIASVELANAMLYSTLTDQTIRLPLDSAAYERALQRLIQGSQFEKKTTEKVLDMKASL